MEMFVEKPKLLREKMNVCPCIEVVHAEID